MRLPIYHTGELGCGNPAFYTDRRLIALVDYISAENVTLLDGTKPIDLIDIIVCGSCGQGFALDELEYRDDK
jgi:hypothetical protein